jgi:hypothetical protein
MPNVPHVKAAERCWSIASGNNQKEQQTMALYDPPKPEIDLSVFADAADIIEFFGWWRGDQKTLAPGHCLLEACSDDWDNDEIAEALGFTDAHSAACWNDAPERTKDEVVARLRAAARGEFL